MKLPMRPSDASIRAVAILGLLLCAGAALAQSNAMPMPGVEASAPPSLTVDPELWSLAASEHRNAIFTFDHHPSAVEFAAIQGAGLTAHVYRALPMVAVQGSGPQLLGLVGLPGLRSVFLDRPLEDSPEERDSVALLAARLASFASDSRSSDGAVAVIEGSSDADGPLHVAAALEEFDSVFQSRSRHATAAIANSWGTRGELSPGDPLGVATKIAYDAGLVIVFATGRSSGGRNAYCAAPGAICDTGREQP